MALSLRLIVDRVGNGPAQVLVPCWLGWISPSTASLEVAPRQKRPASFPRCLLGTRTTRPNKSSYSAGISTSTSALQAVPLPTPIYETGCHSNYTSREGDSLRANVLGGLLSGRNESGHLFLENISCYRHNLMLSQQQKHVTQQQGSRRLAMHVFGTP